MMNRRFSTQIIPVLGGLLIWAAQFIVVYASESLLCRMMPDGGVWHPALVLAATLAALVGLAARLLRRSRGVAAPSYLKQMAAGLDGLTMIAVVWTGLPALFLTSCSLGSL